MSNELSAKLPPKTGDFLRWLDKYLPHRCPELGVGIEEIHRYAGGRDLIDAMLCRWEREQEEDGSEQSSIEVKGE